MLTDEDRRFAIEDARAHLSAQFDLIKFHDQKAVTLLGLYVTLGIAAVGLALTRFGADPLVSSSVAVGLSAAAMSLFVGAMYCFQTIAGSDLSLPGRGFEFWKVVLTHPEADFQGAAETYMIDGEQQSKEMRALNITLASNLRIAKGAGVIAPLAAAVAGLIAQAIIWTTTS